MADRAQAKSRAKSYTKSKKKGAMGGMTVKGGHKLSVKEGAGLTKKGRDSCLLYTSPSPRDRTRSRMPSSA